MRCTSRLDGSSRMRFCSCRVRTPSAFVVPKSSSQFIYVRFAGANDGNAVPKTARLGRGRDQALDRTRAAEDKRAIDCEAAWSPHSFCQTTCLPNGIGSASGRTSTAGLASAIRSDLRIALYGPAQPGSQRCASCADIHPSLPGFLPPPLASFAGWRGRITAGPSH